MKNVVVKKFSLYKTPLFERTLEIIYNFSISYFVLEILRFETIYVAKQLEMVHMCMWNGAHVHVHVKWCMWNGAWNGARMHIPWHETCNSLSNSMRYAEYLTNLNISRTKWYYNGKVDLEVVTFDSSVLHCKCTWNMNYFYEFEWYAKKKTLFEH